MQRRDGYLVKIKIKDERGNVIDEVEAIAFKGLLALVHEDGLKSVKTTVVQLPTKENGMTAVVTAKVKTQKGTFTGTGDASPSNVNRRIAPHVLRMAETRALARAFRLAVNIGAVAIEELGEDVAIVGNADEGDRAGRSPQRTVRRSESPPPEREEPRRDDRDNGPRDAPPRARGRDDNPTHAATGDRRAMSDEQRKLLFRLAFDNGATRENVRDRVLHALGVERLEWATRANASAAIDTLKRELARQGNGQGSNGSASNGHGSSDGYPHAGP
jgi:hypothetical protein